MRIRMFKKSLSLVLSIACAFICLPASNAFALSVPKKSTANATSNITQMTQSQPVVYYKNDFENGVLPTDSNPQTELLSIWNGHALFFSKPFDKSNGKVVAYADFKIDTTSSSIPIGSTIQYDLIVPKDSVNFNGAINYEALIHGESGGYSTFHGDYLGVTSSDFKDLGNGYCSTHVSIPIRQSIPAGMSGIELFLEDWNVCDYTGMIGIDNIDFES